MTFTVSVSDLRTNISHYLERVIKGGTVLIRDEKRNITIAQITQAATFDSEAYEKSLRRAAGIFTSKNHPEWSTLSTVRDWVSSNRQTDERSF